MRSLFGTIMFWPWKRTSPSWKYSNNIFLKCSVLEVPSYILSSHKTRCAGAADLSNCLTFGNGLFWTYVLGTSIPYFSYKKVDVYEKKICRYFRYSYIKREVKKWNDCNSSFSFILCVASMCHRAWSYDRLGWDFSVRYFYKRNFPLWTDWKVMLLMVIRCNWWSATYRA